MSCFILHSTNLPVMRKCFLLLLVLLTIVCRAQIDIADGRTISRKMMDSLHSRLEEEKTDTGKTKILLRLVRGSFQLGNTDSQLLYARKALGLAKKHNFSGARSVAQSFMIRAYRETGRYPEALSEAFDQLNWAEQIRDTVIILEALRHVMFTYGDMKEYAMILPHARHAQRLVHAGYFKDEQELKYRAFGGYMNFIGGAFEGLHQMDSALYYKRLALQTAISLKDYQNLAVAAIGLARYFSKTSADDSAASYFRASLNYVKKAGFRADIAAEAQLGLAKLHQQLHQPDSAIRYARLSLNTSHRIRQLVEEAEAASLLHSLYTTRPSKDSAYKYLTLSTMLKDSLFNREKIKETESIKYKEALRLQQIEQEQQKVQERYTTRMYIYGLAGGALLLLAIAFFWYRLRRLKRENRLTSSFTQRIYQVEMQALRAQMNPHFIFNCLNSINRYIVKSDRRTASNYLTKFSRLIRLILDNSANNYVPLDKEIQTLRLYIDMELLRFDNAFEYSIEVDEEVSPETIYIPSLLLQSYVENAIWHGLLNKESGERNLWIRFCLSAENVLTAIVEDNGVGRAKAKELRSKEAIHKKSYGMQISQDRIFLINKLYNTAANVQAEDLQDEQGHPCGTRVTVKIPAGIS
ncbi:MAG: histidine kinase [Williamsia sp.]|nr:histidine kinase [Williamsia sp.]